MKRHPNPEVSSHAKAPRHTTGHRRPDHGCPGHGGSRRLVGGLSPLAEDGLKRPFLLMGSQASDHHTVRSWEALWSNSDGPKLDLHLRGSKHHSYTDMESLVPQLNAIGLPPEAAYEDIGWTDPARAVAAQRAYLAAFFDRYLRGRDDGLLGGPSARYPEVTFVR